MFGYDRIEHRRSPASIRIAAPRNQGTEKKAELIWPSPPHLPGAATSGMSEPPRKPSYRVNDTNIGNRLSSILSSYFVRRFRASDFRQAWVLNARWVRHKLSPHGTGFPRRMSYRGRRNVSYRGFRSPGVPLPSLRFSLGLPTDTGRWEAGMLPAIRPLGSCSSKSPVSLGIGMGE